MVIVKEIAPPPGTIWTGSGTITIWTGEKEKIILGRDGTTPFMALAFQLDDKPTWYYQCLVLQCRSTEAATRLTPFARQLYDHARRVGFLKPGEEFRHIA